MKQLMLLLMFWAQAGFASEANLLAIGQGVSSPSMTSTINYSNGFTNENPVGVVYQQGARITGHYDTGTDDSDNDDTGYGGELGFGNGRHGIAVGYYNDDCNNCEDQVRGALGVTLSSFSLGVGFGDDITSVGLLLNSHDTHRIGLVYEQHSPEGGGIDTHLFGLGYSYVTSDFTFTVDASKMDRENSAVLNEIILLTPGIALRFGKFAVTVSNNFVMNDDTDIVDDDVDGVWFGVGYGTAKDWHVAIYSDYVNDITAAISFFF